ncbi:helix-turn-helix domain-containing protein [Shewanella sp. C32]|uniref:Helix-turn-helix domain-containing protein n=1 Tax=Shewanella electrica TaxID=515560 RepID=A0ABT2FLF1_9GAMM|nr:helix-turn-helix domain-containing protein [Shewanella electrica]MCS4557108.1 helix-turn-helix domain-containing protein [Shewanella electrica]
MLLLPDFVNYDVSLVQQSFTSAKHNRGEPAYQLSYCGKEESVQSDAVVIQRLAPLSQLLEADTIVIPGINHAMTFHDAEVMDYLQRAAARGIRIASICSGAWVLAASGLLNGKRATTHWLMAAELAQRYPQIHVEPNVLFIDNGQLLTSAGLSAGLDLCLHLVELDLGTRAALALADYLVMPQARIGSQVQQLQQLPASAERMAELQLWLTEQLHSAITLEMMAERVCLSVRSLTRHVQQQFGLSPLSWLQQLRIRRAQALLESSNMSIEQIANSCGYSSAAGLRHTFQRHVGCSPSAWRHTHQPHEKKLLN